jgi:hypothetical protein
VWYFACPRTFYAWLFKKIKKEDLKAQNVSGYKGHFYPYSNDLAMMYPMLEMSGKHTVFIPKIAYIRNRSNKESWYHDKKKRRLSSLCRLEIKKRKKYQPL